MGSFEEALARFGGVNPLDAVGDDPLKQWAVVACTTLSALSNHVEGQWKEVAEVVVEKAPIEVLLGSLVAANALKNLPQKA